MLYGVVWALDLNWENAAFDLQVSYFWLGAIGGAERGGTAMRGSCRINDTHRFAKQNKTQDKCHIVEPLERTPRPQRDAQASGLSPSSGRPPQALCSFSARL